MLWKLSATLVGVTLLFGAGFVFLTPPTSTVADAKDHQAAGGSPRNLPIATPSQRELASQSPDSREGTDSPDASLAPDDPDSFLATLSGRVLDAESRQPIDHGRVRVCHDEGKVDHEEAWANGEFNLRLSPLKPNWLVFESRGYSPATLVVPPTVTRSDWEPQVFLRREDQEELFLVRCADDRGQPIRANPLEVETTEGDAIPLRSVDDDQGIFGVPRTALNFGPSMSARTLRFRSPLQRRSAVLAISERSVARQNRPPRLVFAKEQFVIIHASSAEPGNDDGIHWHWSTDLRESKSIVRMDNSESTISLSQSVSSGSTLEFAIPRSWKRLVVRASKGRAYGQLEMTWEQARADGMAGQPLKYELQLHPDATPAVAVRSPEGNPVTNARATLLGRRGTLGKVLGRSDADGRIELTQLPLTSSWIEISSPDYLPQMAPLDSMGSPSSPWEVTLSSGRRLHGTTSDGSGQPLPHVPIVLSWRDEETSSPPRSTPEQVSRASTPWSASTTIRARSNEEGQFVATVPLSGEVLSSTQPPWQLTDTAWKTNQSMADLSVTVEPMGLVILRASPERTRLDVAVDLLIEPQSSSDQTPRTRLLERIPHLFHDHAVSVPQGTQQVSIRVPQELEERVDTLVVGEEPVIVLL